MKSIILSACFIIVSMSNIQAAEADLEKLPPVVIRTSPVSGYDRVDPALKEIKVTFSKTMMDKFWSFVMQDKQSFPELDGDPFFDESKHTCTLQVKLQPDKTYVIWLNSQKDSNFKDTAGNPAVPYLLAFKTAGSQFIAKKKDALLSTERWLALVADDNFAATWKTAAPFFKKQIPEKVWTQQIAAIQKQLGKVKSRKLKSVKYTKALPGAPEGEYFVISYITSFENKPQAIETIIPMLDKDENWKISGYYIK